jgi:hypothetical protein
MLENKVFVTMVPETLRTAFDAATKKQISEVIKKFAGTKEAGSQA